MAKTRSALVGSTIRAIRQGAGLTQVQLAERAGTSERTLRRVERNETALCPFLRAQIVDAIVDECLRKSGRRA